MSSLLFELYSEEIPALMQERALSNLLNAFKQVCNKYNITFKEEEGAVGPCRMSLYFNGLEVELVETKLRGPSLDSGPEILNRFYSKHHVKANDLTIEEERGKKYYYLSKKNDSSLEDILLSEIPKILSSFSWPKSMRWGDYQISWIRPLKNILCLLDGKVLPVKYGHLTANNLTFGHKFFAPESLKITSWDDYQVQLLKKHVIISNRKDLIKRQLTEICQKNELVLNEDEKLIEEISGLTEYATMLLGEIAPEFMSLPSELLTLCLRVHQRYFTCQNLDGSLANKFIFASNLPIKDFTEVIEGNKRVLAARLSDALYFYNRDLKEDLESKFTDLSNVVFHLKLGNMQEKVLRIEKISKFLRPLDKDLHLAARLCKCDLLTEAVKEFPELQGVMSKYYAPNTQVGEIIAAHYSPKGANDKIPELQASILSIADKIDTLVGLLIAGEKVTSSKDPYGIRRNAISILRIILEHNLEVNLKELIQFTLDLYDNVEFNKFEALDSIQNFILDKFDSLLEQKHSSQIVRLVIKNDLSNVISLRNQVAELEAIYQTEDFASIVAAYKRLYNITDKKAESGKIDAQIFETEYERELYMGLLNVKLSTMQASIDELLKLVPQINNLLDNVLINDQDKRLAQNRINLVMQTQSLFDKVLHFKSLI
ncbi:Putative glycyl-tRNA synthetase subunit beta [Candidatus Phycorickettsia trachydisci]|uniref:Glycine--tRNA ligase beta subunit n=1 Tax=Candidatus Phycorickettsia trachydisci TaxID=2115978 RepID=A0A2P1P7W6_9RICK|nr:glycine--tRNA ligase subunit beta [Candidatus Phycorickettsia trachydisci]AVP87356.1 Putative glycyl-tRNA synthetase subunit beta [Candidatus Phycorickettsia trachydisci]